MKRLMLVLSALAALCVAESTRAAVPALVRFQGRLTDASGQPLSATVRIQARFHDSVTGGALLLTEDHPAVTVANGLFTVALGGGTVSPGAEPGLAEVFRNHDAVWLELQVNEDEPMSPRLRVGASPYALRTDGGAAAGPAAFTHLATEGNTSGAATVIDHPSCNGNPNAVVVVCQNSSPGGTAATVNISHVRVQYVDGRWTIRNSNASATPLPPGSAYNVMVMP